MGDQPFQEKRRSERTELLLKVEYSKQENLLADYLTDLSNGGLFVRTEVPFEMGQRISFTLSFPGLLEPIDLCGIVRWRRPKSPSPETPPGVGVEFEFVDDLQRETVARVVERLQRESCASPVESRQGPFRVLVVEDNQFVHDLFRHAIKKFHRGLGDPRLLEVVSAFNGHEALQKFESLHVDLAIVDHFLPVMSGAELIKRVRSDERLRDIPVLVVSTGGDTVREEALNAGADLYLDKPVLLKQLLATLNLLLNVRSVPAEQASHQA